MTYCLAITVESGLVFASDSRTNAGPDQVRTYSKMHRFGVAGERQLVILSAGNLATSQAVIARIRRDIDDGARQNLLKVTDLESAAEYLGLLSRSEEEKHGAAVAKAGLSAEATFIIGGQIGAKPTQLFLVYPQGNFITTSEHTPFLQLGETKYGKVILDRIIRPQTSLDDAAHCALISLEGTMRSNATVGPPVELLCYRTNTLTLERYLRIDEDDAFLLATRRLWTEKLIEAFHELPPIPWDRAPVSTSTV